MNKAFEKILERLEKRKKYFDSFYKKGRRKTDDIVKNATDIFYDEFVKIVQKVAEEYKDGWIPCSERLPEECTEVLVSVKEIDGSFYTRTSWVQDGVWVIKKTPLQPTVIAWQPLPEPFKERD